MPGRGVALEVDLVAVAAVALAPEEVVEADLVQRGGGGVGGKVTAEPVELVVRAVDHDHRVPADECADPSLDVLVAGEPGLLLARNGVDVVGLHHGRHAHALLTCAFHEPGKQVVRARPPPRIDDRVERLEPLGRLGLVDVGQLVNGAVNEHVSSIGSVGLQLRGPGYDRRKPIRCRNTARPAPTRRRSIVRRRRGAGGVGA